MKGLEALPLTLLPTGLLALVLLMAVSCSTGSFGGERGEGERDTAPRTTAPADTPETTAPETTPVPEEREEDTAAEDTSGLEETEEATEPVELLPDPGGETRSESTATEAASAENGMVASAHPLATEAGLEVLGEGGNAYDAAVAVSAALGVVEPMMSGIGGYGAAVTFDAEMGETRFLETGSRVPEAVDPALFRPPTPGYEENRCGATAVATPGNLRAWETMWEEHGELGWEDLFGPAVRYAEDGFEVSPVLEGWLGSEFSAFPAHAQEIYGRDGVPLRTGDRLVQRDLAASMRTIAGEGADALYGGDLGQTVVSEVQRDGGLLSAGDLEANRAEWRASVGSEYRGHELAVAAPPATSWNALMRLGIMDQFGFGPGDHNTSAYTHAFVEGSRGASSIFREDPTADLSSVEGGTLRFLLSEEYWRERAAEVDFSRATPRDSAPRGDSAADCSPTGYTPTGTAPAAALETADTRQHTTHFTVADREGNVVSSTQTLGNVFGSKVMPRGTGLWMNDSVAWSRFEPEGNVFDVQAGGQSYYALAPTIVLEDGRPRAALGTPGGRTIPQTTAQMVMNLVDFEMDVQRAVSEPRFASFWSSGSLAVDPGFPEAARQELAALGHDVYVEESGIGNAHAVGIEYGEDGVPVRFTGGSDPRGEGLAAGF